MKSQINKDFWLDFCLVFYWPSIGAPFSFLTAVSWLWIATNEQFNQTLAVMITTYNWRGAWKKALTKVTFGKHWGYQHWNTSQHFIQFTLVFIIVSKELVVITSSFEAITKSSKKCENRWWLFQSWLTPNFPNVT